MFSLWMFVYIAIIGVIPIAIGMIPIAEANDAPLITRFARWYASHKWPLLVWYVLLTVVPLGVTLFWNYKNPDIQAQAALNFESYTNDEHGFQWMRMDKNSKIDIPWLNPARDSTGLMWKGFTVVVSQADDKISSWVLFVYGSDQGVGHYVLVGGAPTGWDNPIHGEGHIPIASYYNYGRYEDVVKKRGVLHDAVKKASRTLIQNYRPLKLYHNKQDDILQIYDPESGRNVYPNPDENPRSARFVFGEHPIAQGPYAIQPGLHIVEDASDTPTQQLVFRVRDVYGLPLDHVLVSIVSEYGYKYEQIIPDDMSDITITLPATLPDAQIKISRGGYHTLAADIALNQNVQKVDAVLEPLRKRVGLFIIETEGP